MPSTSAVVCAQNGLAAPVPVSPAITNSQGSTFACGEDEVVLANSNGFLGGYRTSAVSLSVVPVAEKVRLLVRT